MNRKEQLEVMLEEKAEELKAIHLQLQEEEEGEIEQGDRVIPEIHVAISTLRVLHRSLRMEGMIDIKSSKGPDYAESSEHKEIQKRQARRLSKSEERLRDSCCFLIAEYLDKARLSLLSSQTQDDPGDPVSLEEPSPSSQDTP